MSMGFTKPARITGGERIVDVLLQQVMRAETLVNESVATEVERFEQRQRDRANQDDRWRDLSGDFQSWEDESGNYSFGIPGTSESAVQAGQLEYGDREVPPVPLMRMGVLSDVSDIGWMLREYFRQGGF